MECQKKYFNSKANAKKAAKKYKAKYNATQKPYLCPICDCWHLSTDVKMSRKVGIRKRKAKSKK